MRCVGLPHRRLLAVNRDHTSARRKCRKMSFFIMLCDWVRASGCSFGASECEFIIVQRRKASLRWLLWWLIIGTLAVARLVSESTRERRPVCAHLGLTWDLPFWHGTCDERRIDMLNGCCVSRRDDVLILRARALAAVFYRDIAMGIIETWPNNDLTLMRLYQCIVRFVI